jgi:hypothetical protein
VSLSLAALIEPADHVVTGRFELSFARSIRYVEVSPPRLGSTLRPNGNVKGAELWRHSPIPEPMLPALVLLRIVPKHWLSNINDRPTPLVSTRNGPRAFKSQ